MPLDKADADASPRQLVSWRHRQQLAALVALHMGLTCLASAINSRIAIPNLGEFAMTYTAIYAAVYGFQIGQIILLTSWGALAGEIWLCRIPRFIALMIWLFALEFLGERLVLGSISSILVEEQLAYKMILVFAPVVVIFTAGIFGSRRFFPTESPRHARNWQFSIFGLMRITAELAVLLAVAKLVLPRRFEFGEFSSAFETFRVEELIPAMVSASVLPVAFFGLERSRTWWSYGAMGLYLVALALTLASAQLFISWSSIVFTSLSSNGLTANSVIDWWPELSRLFAEYFFAHVSAAATILFTLYLLRCIGYDFRRRDELPRPGGRSASNSRNSAASASA